MSNPFATRFVEPGKIPWAGEESLEVLASRFNDLGRRAAIVGQHGTGKSTLLEHLVPIVAARSDGDAPVACVQFGPKASSRARGSSLETTNGGGQVAWLKLRKGPDLVHVIHEAESALHSHSLWIIDGYEQLSWFRRWRVLASTKRHDVDVLVTTHSDSWLLPTLLTTHVSLEIARKVIQNVIRVNSSVADEKRDSFERWSNNQLEFALEKHQGNLREVLMDMYDEYQKQSKQVDAPDH